MTTVTPKTVLLIAGPTASGKSAVAIQTARERGGVIINADSMQVYRDLRILSARPTAEDEKSVPHRLYGHIKGDQDYSVAHWLAEAKTEIEACWHNGTLPIVCGGTGLYFAALEKGLANVPAIDPAIRDKWRSFEGDLHAELSRRHKPSADRLNAADRQRLIRALEVIDSTGQALCVWQETANKDSVLKNVNIEHMFIDVLRAELHERADRRFDRMVELGAVEEVQALPKLAPAMPILKAIGVPQIQDYLQDRSTLTNAIALGKIATKQYIKRQLTWFRGQMETWKN